MQKIYVSQYSSLSVQIVQPIFETIEGKTTIKQEGRKIRFNNGIYSTSDPAEIELIEKTSSFNSDFFDKDVQKAIAAKIESKQEEKAVGVVSGARTSESQFKGAKPTTAASRSDQPKVQLDKEAKPKRTKKK